MLDRQNYRPVALLSPLSKVLEKIVYEQLYNHFSENCLFQQSLHGYRKHRSTQTALLQLYDRWVRAAMDGKLSGSVLLDLSAAFDLVDSELLIKKLEVYKIDSQILNWIHSYLTDRQQAVWVDHVFSDFLPCRLGVPQGSILGPLLFLIFFNDLPLYLNCEVVAYADDSTLSVSGSSTEEISQKLTENCELVSSWMVSNRLKLNATKTHVMTLGTGKRLQGLAAGISVEMNGIKLQENPSNVEFLLGCKISSNLKWNQQVIYVIGKLKSRIAALENLKNIMDMETRKRLTEGLFISILSYCLPLYGGCDKGSLNSLQVMQNKAARVVTLAPQGTSRKDMFSQLKWFSVKQLLFYHTALATFRIRKSGEPEDIYGIMSYDNNRGNIIVPNTHLSLAKVSYCFRGASEWNQIPQCIRSSENISRFKVNLRKWIFDNVDQF